MKKPVLFFTCLCLAVQYVHSQNAVAKRSIYALPRSLAPDDLWKRPSDGKGGINYGKLLVEAARHADMELARQAVEHGADLDYIDDSGNTALHEAVYNLDIEMAAYLVEKKADLNALNRWGYSSLAWLHEAGGPDGDTRAVEDILQKAGAHEIIEARGNQSQYPWPRPLSEALAMLNQSVLDCASQQDCDLAKLGKYLKRGADPNYENERGIPALALAVLHDNEPLVRLLIDSGADVNHLSIIGSVMSCAAYLGNVKIIDLLSRAGAELDAPNNGIKNPLMLSFERDKREAAKYFLDHGVKQEGKSGDKGKQPIHYAAQGGWLEMVKLLVEGGADIRATEDAGWDAFAYAAWGEYGDVVEYLKSKGADVNGAYSCNKGNLLHHLLMNAKSAGIRKMIFLIGCGVDVNGRDRDGFTPLHYTVMYDATNEFAKKLIDAGADVNAESNDGYTVLFRAFHEGKDSIGNLLTWRGAKVDTKNRHGAPMIVLCAEYNYMRELKAFIVRRADLNATDAFGRTALHVAAIHGNREIYNLLLAKDVRRDIRDKNGMTAEDYLRLKKKK